MKMERLGTRDLTFSAWHRAGSIGRFVGWKQAAAMTMMDLDAVMFYEFHPITNQPLALIEVALDVGQKWKNVRALHQLAKRSNLPAYICLYQRSSSPNPADPRFLDIDRFRIRRVFPKPDAFWRDLSPEVLARGLLTIRAWSAARSGLVAANDPFWKQQR